MLARLTRSLTKLALEVHWTSNLSEFPLRVAFARYALSAKAGRRANAGYSPSKFPEALHQCSADAVFPKLCTNASAKSGFVALQFCFANADSC
ncbi:hypothetical protein CGSMWGv00703Dmash_02555 [Gardnerella greenwoodii 00703Dmash]|uniref:Uncharacterized protein n=1 Tax=Gardnerella greenwoodii 00703Dmash TaxID=698960 RepID=I4M8X8_9BIFI|nr:hypothetical protein CGSMWGv00703Dmash_02555 [Gardnerella greenwoodii 00703Dmash]